MKNGLTLYLKNIQDILNEKPETIESGRLLALDMCNNLAAILIKLLNEQVDFFNLAVIELATLTAPSKNADVVVSMVSVGLTMIYTECKHNAKEIDRENIVGVWQSLKDMYDVTMQLCGAAIDNRLQN